MLDRGALRFRPLAERANRVRVPADLVSPDLPPRDLSAAAREAVRAAARDLRLARESGKQRILAFGAHAIKNGLAPVLIRLVDRGWLTHLATNGAGIIHDWELAYLGETSEDVRENVARGEFGMWQETGYYLNLAIDVGAWQGLGYGESVGALVEHDGLDIPGREELASAVEHAARRDPEMAARAADLLGVVERLGLPAGRLSVRHGHPEIGLQAAAFRLGVPLTGHPMFGHDIIYVHPANHGASIGRTAEKDFLRFASSVAGLGDGGVYLSVGSAVMSPMIFEKSLSMAQNLALQNGRRIEGHRMHVVDLAPSAWDWERDGEPPADNPAYYLRYCKTFSRMGGSMRYCSADNRDYLLALLHELEG
jgi:hypothetical protein